jgi:hypothetical protein
MEAAPGQILGLTATQLPKGFVYSLDGNGHREKLLDILLG